MKEQPNYYAIIPANVRYDEELRANEKLMYGEITALSNVCGYCFASNNYFAELYKVTPQAISKWISDLKSKGYIDVDFEYKDGTKEIDKRIIKIVSTNDSEVSTNDLGGINKCLIPYKQMIKGNNTRVNNINNNNIDTCINKWNTLPDSIPKVKRLTTSRKAKLNARFKDFGFESVIKAIDLINQSSFLKGKNKNGWVISFDWFLEPRNITKILEGNFKDRNPRKLECSPNFDIEEIQRKAIYNDDYDI